MRSIFYLLAAFPALALAAISITGPTSNSYWVQSTSNNITWTYSSGDPSPVSIIIINPDTTILNGAFSIDEYVNIALQSYTVTNVTLKVGSGYQVEFVNPANHTDIYATSPSFQLMSAGTTPAPVSSAASNPSASGVSSSGSGVSSSSTSSGAHPTSSSGAPRLEPILYTLAAGGLLSLCGLIL